MYACGADSGVVNLYKTFIGDRGGAMSKQRGPLAASLRLQRTPFKSIMSLTTKADTLKFNHDGQILAIASQMKKDSLRLVHANTGTVFANWPTGQTPLRYVTDVDFSPSSGLFAIGNDRGKVLLYRLLHYART
jgi:U3 small nucleolar RNA-associated protein 18